MIEKIEYCNIKCDCCGKPMDDENVYPEDVLQTIANECGFKHLGGKDYCPDCWTYDDDDNIVTKDGRKYDEDGKEIVQRKFNYLELSEDMTLTQFQTELVYGHVLFRSMLDTLYKKMLADELCVADEWFNELFAKRRGTAEWECFLTFKKYHMFTLMANAAFEKRYNS